jgi:DNA-binding beta-propeller fold protein YncE
VNPAHALLAFSAALSTSACGAPSTVVSPGDAASPLSLRRVIALPDVKGRIDHLAVDAENRRLYVAEYRNGTVDEIDLKAGRAVGRITGLTEPQGIGFLPKLQPIVVASGDGSVRFYAAADRREVARLQLGEDADNVRIDPRNGHVLVGYGSGGIATIDPSTHQLLSRLVLPGHPEGFRLIGSRAFVNVPDRAAVIVADIDQARILATWPTGLNRLNFPLAVGPSGDAIAVVYRLPARLSLRQADTGEPQSSRSTCGDADDIFVAGDTILVVCGAGQVDVIASGKAVRVATAPGARTGLFVPELQALFVAVPSRGRPAAIWEFGLKRP